MSQLTDPTVTVRKDARPRRALLLGALLAVTAIAAGERASAARRARRRRPRGDRRWGGDRISQRLAAGRERGRRGGRWPPNGTAVFYGDSSGSTSPHS